MQRFFLDRYAAGRRCSLFASCDSRACPLVTVQLLAKSATVQGFFLNHYAPDWRRHLAKLAGLWRSGRLRLLLDPHSASFVGLGAVPDAVEWLQSGRSSGKVYVRVASEAPAAAGSRL